MSTPEGEAYRHATAYYAAALLLAVAALGLAGCGSSQPIDQALQCNQFKRQPDGSWVTTTNVSLDYEQNGTRYQTNFGNGIVITAQGGGQNALIYATLEKKCAPAQ